MPNSELHSETRVIPEIVYRYRYHRTISFIFMFEENIDLALNRIK